jgi:hypothetical protein
MSACSDTGNDSGNGQGETGCESGRFLFLRMTCGNVVYDYTGPFLACFGTATAVAIGFAVWWLRRE